MVTLKEDKNSEALTNSDDFSPLGEINLQYYASEIMEKLGCQNDEERSEAIQRAYQVCNSLNIPLSQNFKRIYRYDGQKMNADWKISSLVCSLLMINGNPCNPNVALAQLFFATQKSTGKKNN